MHSQLHQSVHLLRSGIGYMIASCRDHRSFHSKSCLVSDKMLLSKRDEGTLYKLMMF